LRWRWTYRASLAAVTIDASMDYSRLRELIALSALAALACGLAATQNDLLFVAIFWRRQPDFDCRGDTMLVR
jgi:hypothetical protein